MISSTCSKIAGIISVLVVIILHSSSVGRIAVPSEADTSCVPPPTGGG